MLMQVTDSDLNIANAQLFILKSNSYVLMSTLCGTTLLQFIFFLLQRKLIYTNYVVHFTFVVQ